MDSIAVFLSHGTEQSAHGGLWWWVVSSQACLFVCVSPPLPAAGDVGLMADLLKDLEDPETLKEVEKLMKVLNPTAPFYVYTFFLFIQIRFFTLFRVGRVRFVVAS